MKVANLSGEQLDYWMYQHACKVMEKTASKADFETGYKNGEFQFSTDKALLMDLLQVYNINLQRLAGEWLASTSGHSVYADCPLEAVCRLVVSIQFGNTVEEQG